MSAPAQSLPETRTAAAVFWMAVCGLLFVGVTAAVKHLDGSLPAAQTGFIRYAIGMVFLLPTLRVLRATLPRGRLMVRFALRGLLHSVAVILWFYAMAEITMAEVTALNYLTPAYTALGAALFLGERIYLRRMLAIGVALVGMVVILRPGLRELESGHLAMLASAMFFSVSYLFARPLSQGSSPSMVVAMMALWVTVGLAPFAAAVWQPVALWQLGWLAVMAVLATAGHYAMTLAFRYEPLAVTQPVTFLQLVWAVLLGWLAFGEPPDLWVIVGGGMILAAVSFIAWREYRLAQAERARGRPGGIETP